MKFVPIDPRLKDFATETQARYVDLVNEHRSYRAAARELKMDHSSITGAIHRLKASAALRGYSPEHDMVHTVPDGFVTRGVSTYYDKDGKPRGQWVKSKLDEQRHKELVEQMILSMCKEIQPGAVIPPPDRTSEDLLNVIPMGDPHFGLYAWAAECGDDFDTEIARRLTLGAVDRLLASAPDADTCIILPLGDVFHANDQTNQTPAHKHQLDTDTRFVRVLDIGIQTFRHAITQALKKHHRVIVRFVGGNHDPQAIWALAFTTRAYFADNPRVTVDLSPGEFWFYRFGEVLIGATHGDKIKHEGLLGVMACDRAVDWGATKHRYWYTGHVHHNSKRELPGVICESFRTLAAKDAYAAGHGYRAGRDMVCITQHKTHGEVERHRCDIGLLQP